MTQPITSIMTAQMATPQKQLPQSAVQHQPVAQVKISEELPAKKVKKGGFKEFIADIWKFCVDVKSYTANTVKGIYYGLLSGAGIISASWFVKSTKNIINKTTAADGKRLQTIGGMIASPFVSAFAAVKHAFKDTNILKIVGRTLSLPFKGYKVAINSQNIGKFGKIFAPILAVGVLASYLVKAKLEANRGEANVDHSLNTGHNQVG